MRYINVYLKHRKPSLQVFFNYVTIAAAKSSRQKMDTGQGQCKHEIFWGIIFVHAKIYQLQAIALGFVKDNCR